MRLRTLFSFAVAALLGAALVVLPALAASEAKTIEALAPGCDGHWPTYACWTPLDVTISSGAAVRFVDSGSLEQEVRWTAGPATPACENVPSTKRRGPWEGSCTFTAPGAYSFQGADFYVTGQVTVVSSGSTGTVSTPSGTTPTGTSGTGTTGTGTTTSSSADHSSSGAPSPGAGSQTGAGAAAGGGSPAGSLLLGGASSAVRLAQGRAGQSVHGSVEVSQAGAGGRLEVQLLAARASLAGAGRGTREQVGRAVLARLTAGTVGFTVELDAHARQALRVHGRLALSVRMLLTHAHASSVTIVRGIVVRR